jgi:hypothetical protein
MSTTIFLAKLFGLYMVLTSSAMLIHRERINRFIDSFLQNPALLFLAAIYNIIFGLILVLFHNSWVSDWSCIITILSWTTLTKGLIWLYSPEQAERFTRRIFPLPGKGRIGMMILSFCLGLFLVYKGFSS